MSGESAEGSLPPGVHAALFEEMALDALREFADPLEAARAVAGYIVRDMAEDRPDAYDLLVAAVLWAMVGVIRQSD